MGMDMISVFMFVFGAIIGSFLNVCIVRLPHEQSIVMPRSHCIHCKKMIPWYDNFPLLSYLILRGQCRFCNEKISPRYFLEMLHNDALAIMLTLKINDPRVRSPPSK